MTKNHEIKLAKVGKLVLVSGCEKPVPTRNLRILQAEKETKTDMMNPVMQRCPVVSTQKRQSPRSCCAS